MPIGGTRCMFHNMNYPGFLATFEGPEAGGKSTQKEPVSEWLSSQGIDFVFSREPGGTEIGDRVRTIIVDSGLKGKMSPLTEVFLFQASRAQICYELIRPSLEAEKVVLLDRFSDSSEVYQGVARGLGLDMIRGLNEISTGGINPDLTFYFDLPVKETLKRLSNEGKKIERIDLEPEEFHQKVRGGYHKLIGEQKPSGRWVVVDATRPINEVTKIITTELEIRLIECGLIEKENHGKER